MKNSYLYAGKILWVDLTRRKVWATPTAAYAEKFLGGRGIGTRVVWEKAGFPPVDPVGPENVLSFDSGPLTGTMMPGSGRCHVTSKSPLTGLLGVVSFGGSFAPELKYAGYDHLVITGQAAEPVYLAINNEEVKIRSAANLWGLDTYETPKALRKDLNVEDIEWACIGPAGEKLIRFATIIGNTRDSTGPTGLGAVMGSKKLKAIAVRGTGGLRIARPERFYEVCARTLDSLKVSDPDRTISIQKLQRDKGPQMTVCFGCPRLCDEGNYVSGMLLSEELALCSNKNGYDASSLGTMMAWVTELFEQGIINEKDVGFPLVRGNGKAYLRLADMIAGREGFGEVLAEGRIRAARAIGRGSERHAFHPYAGNKGEVSYEFTEFYGHFAGGVEGTRLPFPKEDVGKAEMIAHAEDAIDRAEIVGSCKWHTEFNGLPITAEVHAEVLSSGLGKKITASDLAVYQQRLHQLERTFNCQGGLRREYDTLPDPYFTDPMPEGRFEGIAKDRSRMEAMKDRYYKLRGWDLSTGVPTRATLEFFNLKDVADELEKAKVNPVRKDGASPCTQ